MSQMKGLGFDTVCIFSEMYNALWSNFRISPGYTQR